MGKMSRDKGKRFERAMVNAARAYGLDARRTAPNQASPDADEGDVLIDGRKCECKHREDLRADLWLWLTNNSFLFLRRNHYPALAVMPAKTLLEMLARERGLPLPGDDVKLEDAA